MTILATTRPLAAQWPQWGGPRRDFTCQAAGLSENWPEDGPPLAWNRPFGDGYSSIIVDDGRLYTMCREGEREVVVALSPETGQTIWQFGYDAPIEGDAHPKGYGHGPRSTPLAAGDRLYAVGFNGTLHCLDKQTGAKRWRVDLLRRFAGTVCRWGYACSPMACGETIIVFVGGKARSIVALDPEDGGVVWARHDFENSYASPVLIQVDGEAQLVCFMAREVVGLTPANGDLLWRHPHENQWHNNVINPVFGDGNLLFVSSEGHGGSRVLELLRRGHQTRVRELWHSRKMRISHRNALRIGDYIYASSGDFGPAIFTAVHAKTGEFAWRERGFCEAAFLQVDNKLLILDEDGHLALATATPEAFTVLAKAKLLEKPAWSMPTPVGKRLYLRDRSKLMAVDLP